MGQRFALVVLTKMNEQGIRSDKPFMGTSSKTEGGEYQLLDRLFVLDWYPLEPGEVVPAVKSRKLGDMAHQIEGWCVLQEYLSHHICCFSGGGKYLYTFCKTVDMFGDKDMFLRMGMQVN